MAFLFYLFCPAQSIKNNNPTQRMRGGPHVTLFQHLPPLDASFPFLRDRPLCVGVEERRLVPNERLHNLSFRHHDHSKFNVVAFEHNSRKWSKE